MNETTALLKEKLNAETAKIHWQELNTHFERGVVLKVAEPIDLVDVAVKISQDDTQYIEALLKKQHLLLLNKDNADTIQDNHLFWAVVVAPWVVIQSTTLRTSSAERPNSKDND